ncbi:hypothetical protein Tco_1512382 [Tanacetum coccineum]
MVIEMLNLLVKEEIKKEKAFKYHFGCKQLKITHMCFANDLIMICHGDIVFVKTLKRALDKFSAISGLCPNLGKCTMFCRSLNNTVKNAISDIFPFKEGKLPVKYLGVHLVTKKIGVDDYKQLIDKGLVFLLPKSIINDIERLFKRFLWNSGESYKGKVKVAWCDVCKPKDQGSLGFKSLETWILGWKCLLSFRNWIGSHMRFRVGNRMSINAWHDKWDSRVIKYLLLSNMVTPVLSNNHDVPIWVDNNGKERKFSTSTVWKDVRGECDKVEWHKLVWHATVFPNTPLSYGLLLNRS